MLKSDKMIKRVFKFLPFILVAFVFLFLRVYHLAQNLNFGSDQGMLLLEIYKIYQSKKFTLIGLTGSSLTVFGRYFYFSSALYYILMPALLLFSWNPISVVYFLILLNLLSVFLVYFVLAIKHQFPQKAIIWTFLMSFSSFLIYYSRFGWGPNYLVSVGSLVLFLILLLDKSQKQKLIFLTLGFFLGLGFGMHYSFLIVVILTFVWLILIKKINSFNLVFLVFGFIIGFSPLIIFESRHNFYNLKTFLLYLTTKLRENQKVLSWQEYYLLGVFPILIYFFSNILTVIYKKNKAVAFTMIFLYFIYSTIKISPEIKNGYIIVSEWNYQSLQKAKEIIISQNKKNYNIVDLLTGDTRAMALRYLLTVSGYPPDEVDAYPSANYLFLYTKVPIDDVLKGSLWEIDVIKPVKVAKTWDLSNGVYLYLLEKTPQNGENQF